MDTRLDSVFGPSPPRNVDPTDTRQGIVREEAQDDHRRNRKDKSEASADPFEDNAPAVSISALIVFLEELTEDPAPAPLPTDVQNTPQPASDRAAMAAHAYQSAGDSLSNRKPDVSVSSQHSEEKPVLSPEDTRIIAALLPDLRSLSAAGIQTLTLEKAPRFLDCIVNAAKKARSGETVS
ncbi:MAG: hypothetical protein H6862_03700 [Rhodospirillales bacterium]|nr:hypothetical protein [Rhodospirillales bacterium]